MSDKRVILHAGFAKTATTSIQTLLARNRAALSRHGVLYPAWDIPGLKPDAAHPPAALALMESAPPDLGNSMPAECRGWLERTLTGFRSDSHRTLILSCETLGERADALGWSLLVDLLAGLPLRLVAYIRVFDHWLEARTAQSIQDGSLTPAGVEALPWIKDIRRFSFLPRLRVLSRALPGEIFVRSFESASREPGVLADFFNVAGIPVTAGTSPLLSGQKPRNVRGHTADLLFLARAGKVIHNRIDRQVLRTALQTCRAQQASPAVDEPLGLISQEHRRAARALYKRQVPRLNAEFACSIDPAPRLISEDLEYRTALTAAEFAQFLEALRPFLDAKMLERLGREAP